MNQFFAALAQLGMVPRILLIVVIAALTHAVVRSLQRASEWLIEPRSPEARRLFASQHPKIATVTSLVVSAATFIVYFLALGLILKEFAISLTAYLATASVVGLALGFGSQGLVQDVVTGLTLVFSDALDVGDMVEVSGQVGRVERIGLRFTTVINVHRQLVYIPNRNINLVSRYHGGVVRAYVDIEIPNKVSDDDVTAVAGRIARGLRAQHAAIIVSDPEIFGVLANPDGGWRYLRVKFRLWPGQQALIEGALRQRILAAMKALEPAYADWMVQVTYRVQ